MVLKCDLDAIVQSGVGFYMRLIADPVMPLLTPPSLVITLTARPALSATASACGMNDSLLSMITPNRFMQFSALTGFSIW